MQFLGEKQSVTQKISMLKRNSSEKVWMPTKTKSKAVCALFLARIVSSSLAAIEHSTEPKFRKIICSKNLENVWYENEINIF
jgi:hypothetical protein